MCRLAPIKLYIIGIILAIASPALAGMGPNAALPATVTVMGQTYVGNEFSAMCIACHTENPSGSIVNGALPFGEPATDYRGSHFVRNTLDGSTNLTANTGIEKLDAWSSGALSSYGNEGGLNSQTGIAGEMICESCHNLVTNVGYKLLVETYNPTTGDTALCEGCHTAEALGAPAHHPQSGHQVGPDAEKPNPPDASHELDITHYSRLKNPAPNDLDRDANTDGVGYYNGVLSCMSCHKPHDAMTSTGARLLRRGRSPSAITNVTDGPVNVVYFLDVPDFGRPAGYVLIRSSTGLHRQSDMTSPERLVTNYDPLCQSCH